MMRIILFAALFSAIAFAQDSTPGNVGTAGPIAPPANAASPVRPLPPVAQPMPNDPAVSGPALHRPDLVAIITSCSSDVMQMCSNLGPQECMEQLRSHYHSLSDGCKSTFQREFPCIVDAANHCPNSALGLPLLRCLSTISESDVSPQCSLWLQAATAEFNHEVDPMPMPIPEPMPMPMPYPDDSSSSDSDVDSDDDDDQYDYENGNHHHHHHRHRHHRWGGSRHHGIFFMFVAVAIVSGFIGGCCAMCCMRRKMRREGGGCCRRGNVSRFSNIPLHHVPTQNPLRYAVMTDDVVPATAV